MSGPRIKVLHLVGADEDTGGVLSVIRSIQSATSEACAHSVWVNHRFRQLRKPDLDLRRSRHLLMETPRFGEFLQRGFRAFLELRKLLKEESFDVLHAHARGPLVVSWLAATCLGRNLLHTIHAHARRRGLYRWVARHPRLRTVVLTPAMAVHYGVTPQPGRIEVISACCGDEYFQLPLAKPGTRDPGIFHLSGVGNIVGWKRWDLLVRAMGRLSPAARSRLQLDIWGPVPDDAESRAFAEGLDALIRRLDLSRSIRLRGPTLGVSGVLRESDWFILPSIEEPCSVALMEALALGVPAIASASGGNPCLIENGRTGWLFRPDDDDDLAQRLSAIAAGDRPAASAEEIRESVRHRSATAIGAAYLEMYRSMAGR